MRLLLLLLALLAGAALLWAKFPLAWAWKFANAHDYGISANAISGTIWDGTLQSVSIGNVKLGDVQLALQKTPLPGQPVKMAFDRPQGAQADQPISGYLTLADNETSMDSDIFTLDIAQIFAPIPLNDLVIRNGTLHIVDDKCVSASGQVRSGVNWQMAIWSVNYQFAGNLSCRDDDIFLHMKSADGLAELELALAPTGAYDAQLAVNNLPGYVTRILSPLAFKTENGRTIYRNTGRW